MDRTNNEKQENKAQGPVLVRPTKGFDPTKYLVMVKYEDSETTEPFLPVPARQMWAEVYCDENGIKLRLEEDDVQIIPAPAMVIVKARLFFNDEMVANGIAGQPLTAETLATAVQSCATKAKGRALANCGFTLSERDDGDNLLPCDSGMITVPTTGSPFRVVSGARIDPRSIVLGNSVQNISSPNEGEKSGTSAAEKSVLDNIDSIPMTLDQARQTVVPFGKVSGKTVGMVAAEDLSYLSWLAGQTPGGKKAPELIRACRMVLESVKGAK